MSDLIDGALEVIKDGADAITSLVRAFEYLNDMFDAPKQPGEKSVIAPNNDIKAEHDNTGETPMDKKQSPIPPNNVVDVERDSTGVYRVVPKRLPSK